MKAKEWMITSMFKKIITNAESVGDHSQSHAEESQSECLINLIDQEFRMTQDNIEALAPGKVVLVCDAYVDSIEDGERLGPLFKRGNVLVLDHHAPIPEMSRRIASTNLAIEFVNERGTVGRDVFIVINHTDCDAILSSAIMAGTLEPFELFGAAAIAADHTGEENEIADLLQALEDDRDISLSLRNLHYLLEARELEPYAGRQMEGRIRDRELAREAVSNDFARTPSGKIAYAEFKKNLDIAMMPSLMPDVEIIVAMTKMRNQETGEVLRENHAKVRLGEAAPFGTDLRDIMSEVDPKWGGRWNAGSNRRKGGTATDIKTYVLDIEKALQK